MSELKIIGQTNLLKLLNRYNVDTFPHSLLLIGEEGSGKHTIIRYIEENILHFPLLDITENISDEYISIIYRTTTPAIYLIDLSKRTEKEQNILLKFIEEPLKNAFIILIAESKNFILNTVLNRCVIFELDRYTKDQLNYFIKDDQNKDLILDVIRTPGKIINSNLANIRAIYDLCDKIVDKINIANFSNTLSIANKINYKDEYDKFDLNIFLDVLIKTLSNRYIETKNRNTLQMYLITINARKKLLDKRINKELIVQNLLTQLWKISRK